MLAKPGWHAGSMQLECDISQTKSVLYWERCETLTSRYSNALGPSAPLRLTNSAEIWIICWAFGCPSIGVQYGRSMVSRGAAILYDEGNSCSPVQPG